jgi:hypothetical protein
MRLDFSRQISEKYSNIYFHKKNLPAGAKLFHAFRNFVHKLKNAVTVLEMFGAIV